MILINNLHSNSIVHKEVQNSKTLPNDQKIVLYHIKACE